MKKANCLESLENTGNKDKRGCRKPPVLVGVTGLEPATSWSQTTRATKLRHAPKPIFSSIAVFQRKSNSLFNFFAFYFSSIYGYLKYVSFD